MVISRRELVTFGSIAMLGVVAGCTRAERAAPSPSDRSDSSAPLGPLDVGRLLRATDRLEAAYPTGPIRERYRHPPADPGILSAVLEQIAPLQLPDEVAHLLRHGGWWPGALRTPEIEGYFEEAVRYGSDPEARITWLSFASTWEQDVCFVPLLDREVSTAPLGLWSTQMLQTSVPAPSIADLLAAFEIALEVLEHGDRGIEDPTWTDLITEAPQPDPTVEEATYRRQALLHERLVPLAATWSSDHPCWVAEEMPLAWTDEPSRRVVRALLGPDA